MRRDEGGLSEKMKERSLKSWPTMKKLEFIVSKRTIKFGLFIWIFSRRVLRIFTYIVFPCMSPALFGLLYGTDGLIFMGNGSW